MGTRPRLPVDLNYQNAHLFAATCPMRGKGAAEGQYTHHELHLDEISRNVAARVNADVLKDRAGWHRSDKLKIPKNVIVILLPLRPPELNPVEHRWHTLRQNWLSSRVLEDYDTILDAGCDAWNRLVAEP